MATDRFRVLQGGATIERVLGSETLPDGTKRQIVDAKVRRQGEIIDKLPDHLVARYDEGEEFLRTLIVRVDEEGQPVGDGELDESEDALAALASIPDKVGEIDDLDELHEAQDDLEDAATAIETAQTAVAERIEELEAAPPEEQGQGGDGQEPPAPSTPEPVTLTDEEIEGLRDEDLDAAVAAAGIDASTGGSLQDGSLSAEEKRDALRRARDEGGGGTS